MTGNKNTAPQPLDLDTLEKLAQEAKAWDLKVVQDATPATILSLIAQARASQPEGATGTIGASDDLKGICIRCDLQTDGDSSILFDRVMHHIHTLEANAKANRVIASNLRAQLAAKGQGEPVAEWVNDEQGFQYLVEPPLPDGTKLYLAAPSPASQPVAPEATQADALHWPHGPTEIACSSCGLTMGESRMLYDLKRGEMVALSAHAQQEAAPADAVLVPRTITEDMHVAAVRVINRATGNADWPPMVWAAMLAAAPVAAVAPSDAKDAAPTTVPDHSEREAANAGGLDDDDRERLVLAIRQLDELATGTIEALGSDNLLKQGGPKKATMADVKRRLPYVVSSLRRIVSKLDGATPATIAAGQEAANAKDAALLKALHAAVSALYFDDSSDFRSALGAVIRHLDRELAGEMLGSPKAAYDKVCAAMAAAPSSAAGKEGGE